MTAYPFKTWRRSTKGFKNQTRYDITLLSPRKAKCTCPAFAFGHGTPCKHIKAVRADLKFA